MARTKAEGGISGLQKAAILLISLELDEIMNCADTIAVIYNGSIQKIAKASELTTNEVGEFMMGVKNKEKEA